MIRIQGMGVSKGIVKGPLYVYQRSFATVVQKKIADAAAEKIRFEKAQEASVRQLKELAERAKDAAGMEAVKLLQTHMILTRDAGVTEHVLRMIEEQSCNAEFAIEQISEHFVKKLEALDDPYMRARAMDIKDVTLRILQNLQGVASERIRLEEPAILVADELAPSETVQLDAGKVLGIVTRKGASNSHMAILARIMGIPAIGNIGEGFVQLLRHSGTMVYMDGTTGELVLDPDAAAVRQWEEKYEEQFEQAISLEALRGKEDITLDGQRIAIRCNIGSPEDVAAVHKNDGGGIGLFRTECLYLARDHWPGEEEQVELYKNVLTAMGEKPVVIRTLDIGADKLPYYVGERTEENPALGVRGIRFCLQNPDMFTTQLRALYRASVHGNLLILFPMITSLWEVRECKKLCRNVMDTLSREGISYWKDVKCGIMIETPAAVMTAEELAEEVDFFSVGTNDLTQYLLACDRQSGELEQLFDPYHPALIRALQMAADAAHKAGIPVGICGELASDTQMLPTFLSMGIDELSVVPTEVLRVREQVRKSTVR